MNTDNQPLVLGDVIRSFQDAFNATDLSKVVKAYTPNGVLMPNNGPVANGSQSIEAVYQALFNTFEITINYAIDDQLIHGDYAFVRTASQLATRVRASGEIISLTNKDLFVLHWEGGSWKIAQYIFNNTAKN